jgi:hypothetical protein
VTAGGFVACFKTVCLLNHIFIILLYMSLYLKCTVTSLYFVVLLKQTSEVKTMSTAHVTYFHNIHTEMSQTLSHSRGSFSSTDHSV